MSTVSLAFAPVSPELTPGVTVGAAKAGDVATKAVSDIPVRSAARPIRLFMFSPIFVEAYYSSACAATHNDHHLQPCNDVNDNCTYSCVFYATAPIFRVPFVVCRPDDTLLLDARQFLLCLLTRAIYH